LDQWDAYKAVLAGFGATASYLFGGWSSLLEVLLAFVVADYITGMMAAGKEGKLNSEIGMKGIPKKVCIFILIAVAHLVDRTIGDANFFRDATIFFYLANELLSITENVGRIGLPIPDVIKRAVDVLGKKGSGN
jgi:toxin secretion/phage lysis holin